MKTNFILIQCTLLLLFVGVLFPSKVFALCYVNAIGNGNPSSTFVDAPKASDLNLDAPIGTVLWTKNVDYNAYYLVCRNSSTVYNLVPNEAVSAGRYETGVPGISYTLQYAKTDIGPACSTALWPLSCSLNYNITGANPFSLTVTLIKTGPIGSGSLTGQLGGTYGYNSTLDNLIMYVGWNGATPIQPTPPTCSVDKSSANLPVPLGDYSTGQFTGVNSMTPAKDFHIDFNCSGGGPGTTRKIYLTLTDATVPANRTDILNLTPSSTTTGLGVRVEKSDGTAVKFGADSSTIGNPNQWQVGTVAPGTPTFSVPLKARFIQTGAVRPGKATAIATFTVAYN
jgi:type 1 fimbria pilin